MPDVSNLEDWINTTALWVIGLIALALMVGASLIGVVVRSTDERVGDEKEGEGYIVSAVLGLLALLMGFTFSLAVDRFDVRRGLVLQEANAIGTTYLRAQLLPEPHRARISGILTRYVDNRIELAKAKPAEARKMIVTSDAMLTDLWAATAAAFDDIKGYDYSSSVLEATNEMIDLDTSRKAGRLAHVPTPVFFVLILYLAVAAGVMGYALKGTRGRIAACCLLALEVIALLLIIDIDRPTMGRVRNSQAPMEMLRASMAATPTSTYDRWRTPAQQAQPQLPPTRPSAN